MAKTKEPKMLYYKLGIKASSFFDPSSRLQVQPSRPGSITEKQRRGSKLITTAQASGHIIQIQQEEYDKLMANNKPVKGKKTTKAPVIINVPQIKTEDELDEMSPTDLKVHAVKFAKTEKQIGDIMKMKSADKLVELILSLQTAAVSGSSSEDDEDTTDEDAVNEDEDTTDDDEDADDADDDEEDKD